MGTRHDANGLDSHRLSQGHTASPIAAIYSGLTDINSAGDVIPGIAEWYEPSSNLMTWTFRLRRGVLFHNGREVDADSVKHNILRLKTTAIDTAWQSGVALIKSVDIQDKYTVRFNLSMPDAAFPAGVMHGLQAPETFQQAKDHPIGSGPFKLVSWKRHDETRLARFENYWETDAEGIALPYLDAITGHYKPEQESRYAALRSGSVDMVDDLTPSQAASIHQADASRLQLWRVHVGGLMLAFNWRREPFRDPGLRLAAALAIDRNTLHQAVFSGQGDILNQPYPPGSPWHMPNVRGLAYDPHRATSLLKQARAIGTEVIMISGMANSDRRQCTELIQQMWNEVGFQVRVDPLFGLQQQTRMQAGTFDAHVHRHLYATDPDYVYRRYFHSKSPDV
ncbi:MAG: ABC transporter substrate-binding protein, partial [Candidatus Tectomicrobia bacterium]|nr:ABC transporter substrate-binding protein [Candidatus Tectomicrobia bacterium]